MNTNEVLNKLIKQYKVLKDIYVEEITTPMGADAWGVSYEPTKIDIDTICFCNNERTITEHSAYCSKCKMGTGMDYYLIGDIKKVNKEPTNLYIRENINEQVFFVSTTNNSIIIEKIAINIKLDGCNIKESVRAKNRLIISPGVGSKSYAIVRGNETEKPVEDAFDWMEINTRTLNNKVKPIVFYENANNLVEFLQQNADLEKKMAFWDVFARTEISLDKDFFFLLYAYIYSINPVVELIAKMGFYKLLSDFIKALQYRCNKKVIKKSISDMKDLFNETTKGSCVFKMPLFVANYLKDCDVEIEAYKFFSDLYELEPFSKECLQYLREKNFLSNLGLTYGRHKLGYGWAYGRFLNILKYDGLTIKKVVSHYYCSDFYKKTSLVVNDINSFSSYLQTLEDLLKMCELLNISYLPLSTNVKEVHDKVVKAFNNFKDKEKSNSLYAIAKAYSKFIPENDKYKIVIPSSVEEFVDEGMQQHNCVASYIQSVIDNKCMVFFIRDKENPNKSFVTAELCNGEIVQIFLKNNQSLTRNHKDVLDFANEFAEKISKEEERIKKK